MRVWPEYVAGKYVMGCVCVAAEKEEERSNNPKCDMLDIYACFQLVKTK